MTDSPPLRLLRAVVLGRIGRRPLTETQRQREAEILDIATAALAQYGRAKIRFRPLAQALRICVETLRWHFADIDDLLGEILRRHLQTLQQAMAEIPAAASDRATRLQAAVKAVALTKSGELTEAHTLLLRERHLLPPDVLDPIEKTWSTLRATLQAALPANARHLLQDQPPLAEAPPPASEPAVSPTAPTKHAAKNYLTGEQLAAFAAARQAGQTQHHPQQSVHLRR